MSNPLVSILVPVYNVEAYLPQCLDSIIGQTYENLQIVLIDDGSKDKSWEIMQEYAVRDSRLEIYHQENQGVATTRNHLLEKIKGDYVLFVDSDDWIELDMVEHLVALSNKYDSPFIMCDRIINDAKPRTTLESIHILSQEEAVHDFLRHEYFVGSLCNKLIKTSLLHNLKFHYGISYGEDALFCWHVLQNTPNVVVTDRQFYHYRMNDGSISHSIWFPDTKGSGHIVWKLILDSTAVHWPKYKSIALGNFVIADIWNIYFAAKYGYKYDRYIYEYQQNIRKNIKYIIRNKLIDVNKIFYAILVARSYKIALALSKFL